MTNSDLDEQHRLNLLRLSKGAGLANVAIGSATLLAWIFGWKDLVGIPKNHPWMAPNTALSLLLIGCLLLVNPRRRLLSTALCFLTGCALLTFGASSVVEWVFPRYIVWPNHFLTGLFVDFPGWPGATAKVMSPNTGFCIALFGLSLVISEYRYQLAQWTLILSQFVPVIALFTLAFRHPGQPSSSTMGMAVSASVGLLAAAAGFLARYPRKSVLRHLLSKTPSGEVMRLTGVAALAIPLFFGITGYLVESVPAPGQPFVYLGLVLALIATFFAAAAFAVRALDQSEEKFRALVENSFDSILLIDEEGRIEFASRQVQSALGYLPEELIGRPAEVLVSERFAAEHALHRESCLKRSTGLPAVTKLDLVARRKNGSEFDVEVSLSPLKLASRTTVTAVIRDISGRKKTEERQKFLAESARTLTETLDYQGRLQKIAELMVPYLADACVVLVAEGQGTKARAASHRDPEVAALLKETVERFPPAAKNSAVAQLLDLRKYEGRPEDAVKEGLAGSKEHYGRLQRLGLRYQLCIPLPARAKVIGWLCLGIIDPRRQFSLDDQTFLSLIAHRFALAADNARLYEEAQKAVRNREDILSVVSHDLKNLITVVSLSVQMLGRLARSRADAAMSETCDRIRRANEQMKQLVQQLLNYGKIQSGTFTVNRIPMRLGPLFQGLEDIFLPLAKKSGIELRFQADSGFMLDADKDALFQALSNLIGNALKFTPRGGRVEVRGFPLENGATCLQVKDTGRGVTPETKARMFERYWQPDTTRKEGVGLGLYIVKGIVEAHHGWVSVESETEKGSCFTIQIPPNGQALAVDLHQLTANQAA